MKWNTIWFYTPLLALAIILLVIGFNIVGKNILLKDVVFSYSALVAAFIMFVMNLFFSLQSEEVKSEVTSYIIHKDNGVSIHHLKNNFREMHEKFDIYNRENLTTYYGIQHSSNAQHLNINERKVLMSKLYDVAKTILIGDIIRNLPDWDMKKNPLINGGGVNYRIDENHKEKDTYISTNKLIKDCKLNYLEKSLSGFIVKGLFLPPDTKIYSIDNCIIIENKFVTLKFDFNININYSWNLKFDGKGYPYLIADSSPHLYNVYDMISSSTIIFNKLYIGNKELVRYRKWADDLNHVFYLSLSSYPQDHELYTG
ncbi:hypothetical protein AB4268_04665 [Vibrio cyclitrophicus]|uniref:hypothetical protein n=1 Tax=Vibrio cyclitrophicus TaxID=47951 RepID=UPI000C828F41|nr:hypothetical protein [Vibrio cyclitrophicus]PMK20148.1 hypothetical protein BCU04_21525 [Vibrio cyclitrophicus]